MAAEPATPAPVEMTPVATSLRPAATRVLTLLLPPRDVAATDFSDVDAVVGHQATGRSRSHYRSAVLTVGCGGTGTGTTGRAGMETGLAHDTFETRHRRLQSGPRGCKVPCLGMTSKRKRSSNVPNNVKVHLHEPFNRILSENHQNVQNT